MKKSFNIRSIKQLLLETYTAFLEDNAIKFSASLAYYTIFGIPPLSILVISMTSFIFGEEAVTGEFYQQINSLVGGKAALEIQSAIKSIKLSDSNTFATIFGGVMLLIGASGVFSEIQSSINTIWNLRTKPNKGIFKFLVNRLMSFSMIFSVGFLLLVSLMFNSILHLLNQNLIHLIGEQALYLVSFLNNLLVFIITMLLFAFIFKALPDGQLRWKDTLVGAGFTALLFMIGKYFIGFYLGQSSSIGLYGAAGSVIIILVWVYYSAIILYFGAEFTKVYTHHFGKAIEPNQYSVKVSIDVVEEDEHTP